MAIVICQAGEKIFLEAGLNKTAGQDVLLKLFSNNHAPANADTAASYTEATFGGYVAITLTGANWATTPGNPTSIAYAQQTFASSGPQATQQIYGYFMVQATSGLLIGAELFSDGPYPIANLNDQIKITPKITGQ
jgi:hypothetical protein